MPDFKNKYEALLRKYNKLQKIKADDSEYIKALEVEMRNSDNVVEDLNNRLSIYQYPLIELLENQAVLN